MFFSDIELAFLYLFHWVKHGISKIKCEEKTNISTVTEDHC